MFQDGVAHGYFHLLLPLVFCWPELSPVVVPECVANKLISVPRKKQRQAWLTASPSLL